MKAEALFILTVWSLPLVLRERCLLDRPTCIMNLVKRWAMISSLAVIIMPHRVIAHRQVGRTCWNNGKSNLFAMPANNKGVHALSITSMATAYQKELIFSLSLLVCQAWSYHASIIYSRNASHMVWPASKKDWTLETRTELPPLHLRSLVRPPMHAQLICNAIAVTLLAPLQQQQMHPQSLQYLVPIWTSCIAQVKPCIAQVKPKFWQLWLEQLEQFW